MLAIYQNFGSYLASLQEVDLEDLFIRTEDIKPTEILKYFVELSGDREIIDAVKGINPVVLVGARGVGKSFLLRVAQAELLSSFAHQKVLAVYVSFNSNPLLQALSDQQFTAWMLAKVCTATARELGKRGVHFTETNGLSILQPDGVTTEGRETLESIQFKLENAWRLENTDVNVSAVPDVQDVKQNLEEICENNQVDRIILLIDEAAHIFLPRQQRLFFSLFRDLRSPYINCKAAVYPGVTSYGSSFQPFHDAHMIDVERNVMDPSYVNSMRDIALRQVSLSLSKQINQYGQNFAILAFASYGNPRVLLKSLSRVTKLSTNDVNLYIREYYRTEVWSEHSQLIGKYNGHRALIDWARDFIENNVLPAIHGRNKTNTEGFTAFFWIHRDAPAFVGQALAILKYAGIIQEKLDGVKNGKSEIGTKYMVNLGCLFALETLATTFAFELATRLDDKKFIEYGARHPAFAKDITKFSSLEDDHVARLVLSEQLQKSIDNLDLTDFQKGILKQIGLLRIIDVLQATEEKLQEAKFIGEVRSRRMRNAAWAAAFEYLSG